MLLPAAVQITETVLWRNPLGLVVLAAGGSWRQELSREKSGSQSEPGAS
jgi:cytochrome c-type biogenesis protein CcmH/NrfF